MHKTNEDKMDRTVGFGGRIRPCQDIAAIEIVLTDHGYQTLYNLIYIKGDGRMFSRGEVGKYQAGEWTVSRISYASDGSCGTKIVSNRTALPTALEVALVKIMRKEENIELYYSVLSYDLTPAKTIQRVLITIVTEGVEDKFGYLKSLVKKISDNAPAIWD
jgi:hypothetical protein